MKEFINEESNYYFDMNLFPSVHIHGIGCLDMSIYSCISEDYVTDQVIITEKQLVHIRERHPEAYDDTICYISQILKYPDYIIKDKRPHTGLVVKQIVSKQKSILLVLRICTFGNQSDYKNSIITSWEISKERLNNYLKNKQILYKRE